MPTTKGSVCCWCDARDQLTKEENAQLNTNLLHMRVLLDVKCFVCWRVNNCAVAQSALWSALLWAAAQLALFADLGCCSWWILGYCAFYH
jgi:hypothetical protein